MSEIYKWSGKASNGDVVKGEITAASEQEVKSYLRKQRIIPKSVSKKPKALFSSMQTLEILSNQTENKFFAKCIGEIKSDVEGGSTFADALKKHPKIFSDLYTNMVAAGEAGGILDTILIRLATYIEKAQNLKRKVKGAMVYPSVTMTVAIGVIIIIMVFVVPTFGSMFETLGGQLPLPTQIIIDLSDFLGGPGGLVTLASIVGFVIFIVQFKKTQRGRKLIDRLILRLPVVGILFKKVAVAKFTRTLGTLISSGVPILDGLNITAKTAGNKVVEESVI